MAQINFHGQDVPLPELNFKLVSSWLKEISTSENTSIKRINYIFCSDDFLLEINKQHLQHDYYTDIITFNLSESEKVESDIYISIDRVKDNASNFKSNYQTELLRVIAHGLLHLIGYNDKTKDEQIIMRKKEDACLSLWVSKN